MVVGQQYGTWCRGGGYGESTNEGGRGGSGGGGGSGEKEWRRKAEEVDGLIYDNTSLNATVKFEIWDTAGQERYHSLAPMYYRGAAAAIIVYDITSQDSFSRAKKWVQELQKQGNPNMVMALAGNKCDLEERRSVLADEARTYAEENGLFFMETSAKTAQNVNEIFYEIAKKIAEGSAATKPSWNGSCQPAGRCSEDFILLFLSIAHSFGSCTFATWNWCVSV